MFWTVSDHWLCHSFKNEWHTYCNVLSRFYMSLHMGKGGCWRRSLLLSQLCFFCQCRSVSCWGSHPYTGLILHWRLRSLWPINCCGLNTNLLSRRAFSRTCVRLSMHCCSSLPYYHSNCIQRLGTPRDVFQYICYPIKSGGNFPIGHKNFKNYGSQVHHNYCCAPFIESSVALYWGIACLGCCC